MANRNDDIIVTREFFNFLLEAPFKGPKEYFEKRDRILEKNREHIKTIYRNGLESIIECDDLDDEAIHAITQKRKRAREAKQEEAKQKETLNVF